MKPNIVNKNDYELCFLNNLPLDTKIYKYIPIKYVKKMFKNKKLIFGKVNDWDDVYENYFLKQDLRVSTGAPLSTSSVMDCCYGQSWTSLEESDAMWRIYSSKTDAVKVATTVEKLLDVLYVDDNCSANTSIGNVIYKSRQAIELELNKMQQGGPIYFNPSCSLAKLIRNSLYTKRSEFEHEHEVRILRMNSTDSPVKKSLVVDIDPQDLFDEIVIDPRATDAQYKKSKAQLIKVGVDKSKISQSQLYTMTRFKICIY
jgi:hypothetical protein